MPWDAKTLKHKCQASVNLVVVCFHKLHISTPWTWTEVQPLVCFPEQRSLILLLLPHHEEGGFEPAALHAEASENGGA